MAETECEQSAERAVPETGSEGVVGSSANWKSHNSRIFSVAAQQNFETEPCKQIVAVAVVAVVVAAAVAAAVVSGLVSGDSES